MSLVRFPVAPLEDEAVGFNLTAFSYIYDENEKRWKDKNDCISLNVPPISLSNVPGISE